jgi:NADH dehydrogenase
MKHRIVVLGAGYAGATTAGRLAKRLHRDDIEITLVNADPEFVERVRMHQLASGQKLRHRPLRDLFAGTGVQVEIARVDAVDVEGKTVDLGGETLGYDTLVYALGSTAADHGVPGVAEHATTWPGSRPLSGSVRAWTRWSPAGPC